MTTPLTGSRYREQRNDDAVMLRSMATDALRAGEYQTAQTAIVGEAHRIVESNPWFDGPVNLPLHAAIVQHADVDDTDTVEWRAACGEESPASAIKFLSYAVYEADVIEESLTEPIPA